MAGGRTLSKVLELNFSLVIRLKSSFLGESNTLGFVVHLAMFQNILFLISETSVSGGQDDIMINISFQVPQVCRGCFLEDKHVHEDKDGNQTSAYICWSPLLFVKVTTH